MGPFAKDSQEYQTLAIFAACPLIYEQILIRFMLHYPVGHYLPDVTGQPVFITTDNYGINQQGHMLYGLVRSIRDDLPPGNWNTSHLSVLVEVHTIPGYPVAWEDTLLWHEIPACAVLIQPHGFLEPDYTPSSLYSPEHNIFKIFSLNRPRTIYNWKWREQAINQCSPPASAYPQHHHIGHQGIADDVMEEEGEEVESELEGSLEEEMGSAEIGEGVRMTVG